MTGIVIITYNSADVIGACLDSCLRLKNVEIVVVDNASEDGTLVEAACRAVKVIANSENRGFAAAANQGIAALACHAVLLLNPDTVVRTGLGKLEAAVSEADVGAAGGLLTGFDGAPQAGFNVRGLPSAWTLSFECLGLNRLWPGNPVNRRYRVATDAALPRDVDQPAGAFLMINRYAWREIGGFDESFHPIWFEDVDFCKRLKEAGYRIRFEPGEVARHSGGHSAARLNWGVRQVYWYRSLLRYSAKHFSRPGRALVGASLLAACLPRALAGILLRRSLKPLAVYSRVSWLVIAGGNKIDDC